MTDRHRLGALILLRLLLAASLASQLALGLSISSPSATKNIAATASSSSSSDWRKSPGSRNERQNSFQDQPAVNFVTTNLPPLITTQSQYNFIDSIVTNSRLGQTPSVLAASNRSADYAGTNSNNNNNNNGNNLRSNVDDRDESMPLATVNNHSKSGGAMRPHHYADVDALLGNRNSANSVSNSSDQAGGSALGYAGARSSLASSSRPRSGLPECATQQVCNAIFVRMNYTQRLCECGGNYNWRCSHNLDPQDGHTIELTRKFDKRIYTQIKTCEPLRDVRACKSPTEWTLLALQSERSGKAHYVVVCKCPLYAQLEGPYTHNHPPYANIPGIRVYGMLCTHQTARSSASNHRF